MLGSQKQFFNCDPMHPSESKYHTPFRCAWFEMRCGLTSDQENIVNSHRRLLFLLVWFSLSAFGQKTFLITNDDPFRRPNSVSTYAIQADGSLLKIGQFPTGGTGGGNSGDPSGQGIGFIPTTRIVVSSDNRFVFATNAPDNTVSAFSVDSNTGILTLVPGSPFSTGGDACQGMGLAVSPTAPLLYAMNTCSRDVTSFKIGSDGVLTTIGVRAGTGDEGEDVRVTADGKLLVVSLSGFELGVAAFTIGPAGDLTAAPGSPFRGSPGFPGSLETNCGGDQVFVLNDGSPSSVDVFKVAADGSLTLSAQSPFLIPLPSEAGGEVSMYLSPDQKALFVGDVLSFASSFHVASDGMLTPESSFVPASGTFFMGHVVTDPAGKFLYGSGLFNNLAAYSVDNNGALSLLPASPFSTPGFNAIGSFAAYPGRSCSLTVSIELKPQDEGRGNPVVTLGANSGRKLKVAVLSSSTFDASTQVDITSLTFGHTGTEQSLVSCSPDSSAVNGDSLPDLVCSFDLRQAGFVAGDTQAVLHGKTISGTSFAGTAPVNVVP
jgi:6-phosphogluconolactonase (cycloisomerase 2 family)